MGHNGLFGELNPAWRGGHAGYRGPSWIAQRAACRERDQGRCVECGETGMLTVHHRVPFRLFERHEEANALNNLVLMCRPCHSAADNAFWATHPNLMSTVRGSFPDCRIRRVCDSCGEQFEATARALRCLKCCTHTCAWCDQTFVSRKRRAVRFCSRACNIAFRQSERTWTHACMDCGTPIRSGRYRCISCHLADPLREVRPGRRPGRPPKDRSAA